MLELLEGDCRQLLATLPAESVQCCVTSPPYWGLRDYGTATWEGGDGDCDHKMIGQPRSERPMGLFHGGDDKFHEGSSFKQCCGRCGAKRIDSQLGLEPTPEQYVANMVEVFRQVHRVLKPDGTLWLNLGDVYAHSGACGGGSPLSNPTDGRNGDQSPRGRRDDRIAQLKTRGTLARGLKPKDLVGQPWRVAFALQADGWWLRSDIIWHKPNPMPESVTDRPTKAHEYIFLLSKSERYYYDADAIREPHSSEPVARNRHQNGGGSPESLSGDVRQDFGRMEYNADGRNKRSVWTIPTAPYAEAHFATFPPDLIKPCIFAGTKAGDVILDPFAGSGTTGMVALELGRRCILIELSSEYAKLIRERTYVTPGFMPPGMPLLIDSFVAKELIQLEFCCDGMPSNANAVQSE